MKLSYTIVVANFAILTFILLFSFEEVDAKRGCATFGHSCYGAMGKRMSISDLPNEEELQDVQQQGNSEIVFTGPRKDNEMEPERKISLQQLYNLSPMVRQWLQNYRKAQDLHSNNYY